MTTTEPAPVGDHNPFTTWSTGRLNLTVLPVWMLALAAALIIGFASPSAVRLTWVSVALAAIVILTFAIQLFLQRKDGFVVRAMVSIGVSILILAAATGVFALLG